MDTLFSEFSQLISLPRIIVFFNFEIPKQFTQPNLKVKTSEGYLSKEDFEEIDKYVFEGLSKSWYVYKNITDYHSIPLGQIFEYDFQKYLIPRIKNLEIIRRIIEKENAQQIVVIEDTSELIEVARLYGKAFNMPVLEISFNNDKKLSFKIRSALKSKLSVLLNDFLDLFIFKKIAKLKNVRSLILIDARLSKYFTYKEDSFFFMPCLLEKGLDIRLDLIRKGFLYLSLSFTKDRHRSKDWAIFQEKWNELSSDKGFKSVFMYKGISIWEIVHKKLSNFFTENIPRIIGNINMLEAVHKRGNIKIAVLRNDVKEFERTIILSSHLTKVPSLVIQHGILAETNGHNILLADKYAAWGRAAVDWYKRFGNAPEKFEITGNPHFDIFANWKPQLSKAALCKRFNLDEDKGIILFATQQVNKFSSFWTDDLFWVMADKLLTVMQQFPDKQLIIKVDPYEDIEPYRDRIIGGSYNNVVAVKDIDIYTLISFSEVIITLDSTVGLEAMIFDKPLITVNLTKRRDRVPYAEKGAAVGVYEEESLPLAIKKTLIDHETISQLKIGRNRFFEEYVYGMDGKASERISRFIKHYIEN